VSEIRNLVLAGFMGTGKSTVGRLAGRRLGMPFVDTDAAIVRETGWPIATIFAEQDEAAFREIEAAVCQRIAAQGGQVVAVGGGALLDGETRAAFEESGLVVCLNATFEAVARRVGRGRGRPLFEGREEAERLYRERAKHYASLPHQIDTTGRTPGDIVEEVVALWKSERSR
jgi:shikimate kinase